MNRPNANAAPVAYPIGATAPGGSKITPVDPVRVLLEYAWLLVLTAVVGLTIGVGLYFVLGKFVPKYRARAVIVVGTETPNVLDPTRSTQEHQDLYLRIQRTESMRVKSEDVLQKVLLRDEVKQTGWYQEHRSKSLGQQMRKLDERLSVNAVRDSQFITVSVTMKNASDPAVIANNIVAEYLDQYRQRMRSGRSAEAESYANRRTALMEEIGRLEDQIERIVRDGDIQVVRTSFSEVDAQLQEAVLQQATLEQVMVASKESYESLLAQQAEGTQEFSATDLMQVDNDPEIRRQDANVNELEKSLRSALMKFGPGHPTVQSIEREIDSTNAVKEEVRQRLLVQLQNAKVSDAKRNSESLMAQYKAGSSRLEELRTKKNELDTRVIEYNRITAQMEEKQELLKITEAQLSRIEIERSHPGTTRVEAGTAARPPDIRSFPPKIYVTAPMTSIVLTGFVLGLVFLKEMLDSRIKSPSCSKLLPDNHLLGVIPDLEEDPDQIASIDLVVTRHPTGLMAETIRQMRIELQRKIDQQRYKTLMVTGCQPASGTTSVATNLAASMAANGKRVLVVDANFRKPAVGRVLGVENELGLADLLAGEATLSDVVVSTPVPGMDAVLIGRPNSVMLERLESDDFSRALRDLEQEYDLILIDAPPLSIVSDAKLLADRVQSVLLVARAMQEKRGLVARLINQLNGSRADFIGMAINGVRSNAGGYFRRNFKAFYHYQNGSMSKISGNGSARVSEEAEVPAG